MTWKELKELAEEAGVDDSTELNLKVSLSDSKHYMFSELEDKIWTVY